MSFATFPNMCEKDMHTSRQKNKIMYRKNISVYNGVNLILEQLHYHKVVLHVVFERAHIDIIATAICITDGLITCLIIIIKSKFYIWI